jgi:putative ABC transport system ATP-binding protein
MVCIRWFIPAIQTDDSGGRALRLPARKRLGLSAMTLLELRDIRREYVLGSRRVAAVRGVSFALHGGECVSVMGPSGAGKSTLLHLMGGLDTPTSGRIMLDGVALDELDDDGLAEVRRRRFGFVFQFFNLLPMLSAWENVALPALLDGTRLRRIRSAALDLLDRVGLADHSEHRPAELSGGQMQRVAVARALIMNPVVLLADEPTGNLDSATGEQILRLLVEIAHDDERAVAIVTHDRDAAGWCDRTIVLADGRVVADGPPARVPGRPADAARETR